MKHYFTGLMDEREVGDSNYSSDQITERINVLLMRVETLLQGATTATSTVDSNNNDDSDANETHYYHDEVEGFGISDEDTPEEIISIIDRRNW